MVLCSVIELPGYLCFTLLHNPEKEYSTIESDGQKQNRIDERKNLPNLYNVMNLKWSTATHKP